MQAMCTDIPDDLDSARRDGNLLVALDMKKFNP
jgi:hypothetical protein